MNSKLIGSLITIFMAMAFTATGTYAFYDNQESTNLTITQKARGNLGSIMGSTYSWSVGPVFQGETVSKRIDLGSLEGSSSDVLRISFDVDVSKYGASGYSRKDKIAEKLVVKSICYGEKRILKTVKRYLGLGDTMNLRELDGVTLPIDDSVSVTVSGDEERTLSMTVKFDVRPEKESINNKVKIDVSLTTF